MKKACFLFILSFSSAHALLSPLNESIREMKAVLNSRELQDLSDNERILELIKTGEGYLIFTDSYQIRVRVETKRTQHIGPRQFELKFGKPVPLS